jgi:dihydrofolate synthase/folylpolyglutamate synthase
MTYAEAVQFLYGLRLFGANFGLENTFKLAALAGNPQEKLRFIHVAGTNGKGSTCAMLESIYRAAGLRVGLFTSPHLVSFRERIQVNRQLIPEADIVRLVEELRMANKENEATLFEFATVMALKFFAEQKCDLVIWETGLGGRLDSTNIVTPLASVITNIALDHQQWLGDTLGKIAAEKAGIIKPGVPVATATDAPEALAVIEKIARAKNAPLFKAEQASRLFGAGGTPVLPLPGDHQKLNAALALATVDVLQNQIPVSDEKIRAGLAGVNWPGRLQLVQRSNGQKILLDGAHNVAGAKVLREALISWSSIPRPAGLSGSTPKRGLQHAGPETGAPRKFALILGVLQDKDWQHICETLAPLASRIFTVPVASERAADADGLAMACRAANPSAEILACANLAGALEKSATDAFVVITGSLYLVGEALEILGISPAGQSERGLNEWNTATRSAFPQR